MKSTSRTQSVTWGGLLLVFTLIGQAFAQGGTWETKAPLPTGRTGLQAEAVGGAVYAIGGVTGGCPEGAALASEAYDPVTNTWSPKATLPPPPGNGGQRAGFATAVVDGKIYAFGGGNCLIFFDDVQVYDPTTDSWSVRGPMPVARATGVAAAVNGKIYLIAGYSNPSAFSPAPTLQYDPSTDTWATKANVPTPRINSPGAAVIGGKIYVVGGASATTGVPLNTLEAYDPATDMWTTLAPMLTGRNAAAVGNVNGLLYAFGGGTPPSSAIVASGEVYDPALNVWSAAASLPAPRASAGAAVLGGVLYVIGGQTATIHATTFAFTAVVPFAAFTVKVEITLGPLANDDEFEVKGTFTLGAGSNGLDIPTEIVSLQLTGGTGAFSTTIPAGSFVFVPAKPGKPAHFKFEGVIDGVSLEAKVTPLGGNSFEFKAEGQGTDLTGMGNPVTVKLTIGNDGGSAAVTAEFD